VEEQAGGGHETRDVEWIWWVETAYAQTRTDTRAADVPNPLFYNPNTRMLFGDAKELCDALKVGIEKAPK
jgi:hypothetical protein